MGQQNNTPQITTITLRRHDCVSMLEHQYTMITWQHTIINVHEYHGGHQKQGHQIHTNWITGIKIHCQKGFYSISTQDLIGRLMTQDLNIT